MPPPELVWNVFRLATDEALIQERKNGVGGRSSAEQDPDHAEKFASPLPDYDIVRIDILLVSNRIHLSPVGPGSLFIWIIDFCRKFARL